MYGGGGVDSSSEVSSDVKAKWILLLAIDVS